MPSLKEQIAALEAQNAKLAITDAERDEIALRAKLARLEAERDAILRERMALEGERRRDVVLEANPSARLDVLVVPERMCIFVIDDPGSKAYDAWNKGVLASESKDKNKKTDLAVVNREYALKAVVDFTIASANQDGSLGFESSSRAELDSAGSTVGAKLVQFLRDCPAIAGQIVNQATTLAGLAKEERKS